MLTIRTTTTTKKRLKKKKELKKNNSSKKKMTSDKTSYVLREDQKENKKGKNIEGREAHTLVDKKDTQQGTNK